MDVEVGLWICTSSGGEESRQQSRRGHKCQGVYIEKGELTILNRISLVIETISETT